MVLASTASSSCYSGEWSDHGKHGPWRTDCDGAAEEPACYHGAMYENDFYVEKWGCGTCEDQYGDGDWAHCEDCSYDYCNYAGDDHDSGAGQLIMSTLSVLIPAALLH